MTGKTMVVGSPEHRAHQEKEAMHHIENAMSEISDPGIFTDDQQEALKRAIWGVYHAICRTI